MFKNMKLSVFIFCVLLNKVSSSFCYWNSGCPYKYFSDKTSYNNVRGDIRDSIVKLKGCQPISVWALFTAGKSLPDNFLKSINESIAIRSTVISSYEQGKSSICAQDIENIQTWNTDSCISGNSNFLTDEGSVDLKGIAHRLQKAFPNLLHNLKENYTISPASSRDTEESAKSFIKGFSNEHLNIVKADEKIVAPHKTCKQYQNNIIDPNTYIEVTKYKKSGEYLATKDRIQRRLGIDYELSDEKVKSLYDMCRYIWSGINNEFSPWCALFTTEDLKVLEYINDLEYYYKNGYGNDINTLLGKLPIADLLRKFQEAKSGKGHILTSYFIDTAALNMAATALNLFKDEYPLSAKRDPKRKWRNTKLSVFSANLIAVLNRCNADGETDFNVVFYWNEEPLLPICERGFCSWDEFNLKLLPFLNSTLEFCNI